MPPTNSSNENTNAPKNSPPTPPPVDPSALKQIRTFQGDVAAALEKQKASIYSIQQAEKARSIEAEKIRVGGRVTPVEAQDTKGYKKAILLFFGTLLCLALAGGIGWYAYKEYKIKTALPVIPVQENRLLAAETTETTNALALDRDEFVALVRTPRTQNGEHITHINLIKGVGTTTPIRASELVTLLRAQTPGNLIRALDPLFMFGVLGNEPNHPFILFKLDSYENAYAGMLVWEPALKDDLLPLFASDSIIASTTPETVFSDITIQNKDARILKDSSGTTILLYSFFDNEMLIVTDNEATLKSLIQRLTAEKLNY